VKFVIYDLPSQKINDVFAEACRFIDTALTVNNANAVLVHCNAGVSRSTTIVIAYLLHKRMFKKYKDALDHVKAKRAVANPNSGFVEQLVQFEKQLNSSS
jgi:protein-tyrosine phosphatase